MNATIFALATAPGRAAVAVMRLSGPETRGALTTIGAGPPPARRASLRRLRAADGALLDEAIVLWMPGPASFTGEDCAELHLHGGVAVVDAVAERLTELGLLPAEPGAFTRRAFESGRIDLLQAEAVADLVDAETAAQRRQALEQLGGAASHRYEAWRGRIVIILARLEAAVDFPDEELPQDILDGLLAEISQLATELEEAAADRRGETIREGFRVALMGPPNAGKSSLFNVLLGRDAAIVSDVPGTTRDVIEAELVMAGRRVILADLAGLRDTDDHVESEGVRRAKSWGERADLRLWLGGPPADRSGVDDLVLVSKADIDSSTDGLRVSAATGEGLPELQDRIKSRLLAVTSAVGAPAATRERHRAGLLEASCRLRASRGAITHPELASDDVRSAARALERLTGRVDAEDILGMVFATFCIGK